MAIMIPIYKYSEMQETEKRVYDLIEKGFSADCYGLSEIHIGNGRPDFMLIGPDTGLIIMEVKDIPLKSFVGYENNQFILDDSRGKRTKLKNPWDQIQSYRNQVYKRLFRSGVLHNTPKDVKTMSAIIFGQFTRDEYKNHILKDGKKINSILDNKCILFRDDLDAVDNGFTTFKDLLRVKLNIPYIGQIEIPSKWVVSVKRELIKDAIISNDDELNETIIRLDDFQATFAKSLPNENIIIRGAAGSGKTIILQQRAKILAQEINENDEKALYTYFNVAIGEKVKAVFNKIEATDNLDIINVDKLLKNPVNYKYKYILVDEAQDIELEKLNALIEQFLAEDGCMTICSDGGQNIYSNNYRYDVLNLDFSLHELSSSYRTTARIQGLATSMLFHPESKSKISLDNIDIKYATNETHYMRLGTPVDFIHQADDQNNLSIVEAQIKKWKDSGISCDEIAVVSMFNHVVKDIAENSKSVKFSEISRDGLNLKRANSVTIGNVNHIKGYEFRNVLLIGYDKNDTVPDDQYASRLYVGMTRATHELAIVLSSKSNPILELTEKLSIKEFSNDFNLRVESFQDDIKQLEYENESLRALMDDLREIKDSKVDHESGLVMNPEPTIKKEIVKEKVCIRKNSPILIVILLFSILSNIYAFNYKVKPQFNTVSAEDNLSGYDQANDENVIYEARLTGVNHIDFMFNGKPIMDTSGQILDNDYKKDTTVKIIKKDEDYQFVLNGCKTNQNEFEIKTIDIGKGRFALVMTNNNAEIRYKKSEEFNEIADSFDTFADDKYFVFLYTDTGEIKHQR